MEEEKNLKVNKIYILIAITIAVILLIIEGIVLFDAIKNIIKESEPPNNSMPSIKFKPTSQILDNETYCQQDSDCVLVMSDGCCPVCEIKEAINIQVNQKRAEKNHEQCAKKDSACVACVPEIGKKKAVCEQNKCTAKATPVVSNADLSCEDLQKNIEQEIDNLNFCQTKDDCAVMKKAVGCPFGCWNFVSKQYADDESLFIQSTIDDFFNKCPLSPICEMCVPIPPNIDFNCVDSKCVEADSVNNSLSNANTIANANIFNQSDQYKVIGSYTSPGESSFIDKIGNTVFMTDISEGLLAIDVSNPEQPKLLSKLKIGGGGAYALAIDRVPYAAYALVSGYGNTTLALIEINFDDSVNLDDELAKLKVVNEINTKRSVQAIARSAHLAYLAIDGPEVEILRVEKETSFPYKAKGLTSEGVLSTSGGHAIGIATPEGTAQLYTLVVAQGENGLGIYDLSRSDILNLKSNISDIGYVSTVAISGNSIFAGIGNSVKIFDINTKKEIPKRLLR